MEETLEWLLLVLKIELVHEPNNAGRVLKLKSAAKSSLLRDYRNKYIPANTLILAPSDPL